MYQESLPLQNPPEDCGHSASCLRTWWHVLGGVDLSRLCSSSQTLAQPVHNVLDIVHPPHFSHSTTLCASMAALPLQELHVSALRSVEQIHLRTL